MPRARWEFRPGIAASVALLLAVPLFVSLGFWQLSRAQEKENLQRQYALRAVAEPVQLDATSETQRSAAAMQYREVRMNGIYDLSLQYLLDNQVYRGAAGYLVYTPYALHGGEWHVLVNRGWVNAGLDRGTIPPIAAAEDLPQVRGQVRLPPFPGLRSRANPPETVGPGLARLQEIDFARIAAANGWRLLPYEVRLIAPSTAGLVRDWPEPGSGRERHLGYAFQWFLFAAAAIVLYVILNMRRNAPGP